MAEAGKDLLGEIRAARDGLIEARKQPCSCSGFIFQYEGGCQCGYRERIVEARAKLDAIIAKL